MQFEAELATASCRCRRAARAARLPARAARRLPRALGEWCAGTRSRRAASPRARACRRRRGRGARGVRAALGLLAARGLGVLAGAAPVRRRRVDARVRGGGRRGVTGEGRRACASPTTRAPSPPPRGPPPNAARSARAHLESARRPAAEDDREHRDRGRRDPARPVGGPPRRRPRPPAVRALLRVCRRPPAGCRPSSSGGSRSAAAARGRRRSGACRGEARPCPRLRRPGLGGGSPVAAADRRAVSSCTPSICANASVLICISSCCARDLPRDLQHLRRERVLELAHLARDVACRELARGLARRARAPGVRARWSGCARRHLSTSASELAGISPVGLERVGLNAGSRPRPATRRPPCLEEGGSGPTGARGLPARSALHLEICTHL